MNNRSVLLPSSGRSIYYQRRSLCLGAGSHKHFSVLEGRLLLLDYQILPSVSFINGENSNNSIVINHQIWHRQYLADSRHLYVWEVCVPCNCLYLRVVTENAVIRLRARFLLAVLSEAWHNCEKVFHSFSVFPQYIDTLSACLLCISIKWQKMNCVRKQVEADRQQMNARQVFYVHVIAKLQNW